MGLDYTVHLGPYVVCKFTMKLQTSKIRSCPNDVCSQHKQLCWDSNKKFCVQCGRPISMVEVMDVVPSVDTDVVQQEFKERLCLVGGDDFYKWMKDNKSHIWISNAIPPKGSRQETFDPTSGMELVEVNLDLITEEVFQFVKLHVEDLEVLRKHYGDGNVKVRWGLLSWVS